MKTNNSILQNVLKKSRPYEEGLIEDLKDPETARMFLEVTREEYEKDGDDRPLLRALRYISEAQDGTGRLLADLGYRIRLERKKEAVGV